MAKEVRLSSTIDLAIMVSFHRNCASDPGLALARTHSGNGRITTLPPYKATALLWELTGGQHGLHVYHQLLGEDAREGLQTLIEMAKTTKDPEIMSQATYAAIISLANIANDNSAGEKWITKRTFGDKKIAEWMTGLFGKNDNGSEKTFVTHPTRYAEAEALKAKSAMLKAQEAVNVPAEPKPRQNQKSSEPATAIGAAIAAKNGK